MKQSNPPEDKPALPANRVFLDALDHLEKRDGILSEVNRCMGEGVQAVLSAGGKAVINLKVEISRRDINQVMLSAVVSDKLPIPKPIPKPIPVTLFTTEAGGLQVTDPNQPEFPEIVRLDEARAKGGAR